MFGVMCSSVHVHVTEPMWVLPARVDKAGAQQCVGACDGRSHQSGGSAGAARECG